MQIFNTRRTDNNSFKNLGLASLFLSIGCAAAPALAAPPSAPSAPNMVDGSDSGSSWTDNNTKVTKPVFSGTAKPLAFIELFAGQLPAGVAIAGPNGQWTVNPSLTLSDGTWTMTARQTANGYVSAVSNPLTITIDTKAPIVTVPDMTPATDFGFSSSDNITNTIHPSFQGTATPGTTVNLFNTTLSNTAPIGSAKVSAQGKWVGATSFPSGTHSYHAAAQAVDLAGNKSSLMGWLPLTIDTDIPATSPQAPDLLAASDSGASQSDNLTNITQPTFTAKAEPKSIVKIYGFASEVALYGTQVADSNGVATVKTTAPIPDGYFNVYSIVTDVAGNSTGKMSDSFVIQIDTTPPFKAGPAVLFDVSNSGLSGDYVTNVNTPIVGGVIGSDDSADLTVDFFAGVFHYTAKTKVPTQVYKWQVQAPTLPDGLYKILVTNLDKAGNTSVNDPGTVLIDTSKPKVAITSPVNNTVLNSISAITGTASDLTSGLKKVELVLKCDDNTNRYWDGAYFNTGKAVLYTTITGNTWSCLSSLPKAGQMPAGTCTLTAQAIDDAGNVSTIASISIGNATPQNVGVSSGLGTSQAGIARDFTATYLDTNGAADIAECDLLIAPALQTAGTLTGRYYGGKLYLVSDNGQTVLGGYAPGSAKLITNSQGTLDCSKTTVTVNGNAIIIHWNFTPSAKFVGTKKVYALVIDKQAAQDGWDASGDWTVTSPASAAAQVPSGYRS
ncbi:hypothetical protein EON80_12335 [bacterium]|nr:MAG: hypothetical protein EON80_12335 [bacterium]